MSKTEYSMESRRVTTEKAPTASFLEQRQFIRMAMTTRSLSAIGNVVASDAMHHGDKDLRAPLFQYR